MSKITTFVRLDNKKYLSFHCRIHTVSAPEGLLIESEFYTEHGELPQGTHHELEILGPELWNHDHSGLIHFHRSSINGKYFVCYPRQIPSLTAMSEILNLWSVGTAFTMIHGTDFQRIYTGDQGQFFRLMKNEYHLTLTNAIFSH